MSNSKSVPPRSVPPVNRRAAFEDRIRGLVFGHALGDAVGLCTEFRFKADSYKITFPYKDSIRNWPPNDWTDDTDQMVLLMELLCESDLLFGGKFPQREFANKMSHWVKYGFAELGDKYGLGLGGTTAMVVNDIDFLDNPESVAKRVWRNSGKKVAPNGGVMRTSIMALANYHSPDVGLFMDNVRAACTTTHYDPRCIISCWTISLICRQLLLGETDVAKVYTRTVDACTQFSEDLPPIEYLVIDGVRHQPTPKSWLDENWMRPDGYDLIGEYNAYMCVENLEDLNLDKPPTIGYTYRAMACGVWALPRTDFKKTITELALECGDADTNCACAGAVLGAKLGFSRLPKDWIDALPNRDWLHSMVDTLLLELNRKSTPIKHK